MCIPIFFGCATKIKPEDEQALRVCPRCHNMTVFPAKSTTWFELFWVPLIPFSRKHIWICGTCQWREEKPKNQTSTTDGQQVFAPHEMVPPNRPGYQPAYIASKA